MNLKIFFAFIFLFPIITYGCERIKPICCCACCYWYYPSSGRTSHRHHPISIRTNSHRQYRVHNQHQPQALNLARRRALNSTRGLALNPARKVARVGDLGVKEICINHGTIVLNDDQRSKLNTKGEDIFTMKCSPLFKELDDMLAKRNFANKKLSVYFKLKCIFQHYIDNKSDKRFFDNFWTPRDVFIIRIWLKELDSTRDTPKKIFEKLITQLEADEIPSQLSDYIFYTSLILFTEKNTSTLDEKSTDSLDKCPEVAILVL